jgi:glycosyltransferase involved in cell wall biosynthesis
MRILHAIQELQAGGAERLVVALSTGAREAGHVVAVAAAPGVVEAELPGPAFPLPLVARSPWRLPAAARALDRALRTFRPNVVHLHNPGIAVVAALATARGLRVPGLVSVHGIQEADLRRGARVLRAAGFPIVSCGPGVTAGLEEQGCPVAATIVNGISPAPPPADRAWVCRQLGVRPELRLVVAAGRLVPLKNHALAIRALADVPGAALAILGTGPLHDELARDAERAGVSNRVVLAGFRPDTRALIGSADAVVLPSESEGLPLVALEALAAGTPLVATSIRGIRELVDDSTAVIVPRNDEQALSAGLRQVLEDETFARRLTEAGLELAARYSEEVMVRQFLSLYETLGRRTR